MFISCCFGSDLNNARPLIGQELRRFLPDDWNENQSMAFENNEVIPPTYASDMALVAISSALRCPVIVYAFQGTPEYVVQAMEYAAIGSYYTITDVLAVHPKSLIDHRNLNRKPILMLLHMRDTNVLSHYESLTLK